MDSVQRISRHEVVIVQYLTENQIEASTDEGYSRLMVVDREHHHYQLIATGWATPSRFVDTLLVHLQIKADGKIWLLENSTELHVAEELVSRGVAKTDIVLAFHPPGYRAFTGYAVA